VGLLGVEARTARAEGQGEPVPEGLEGTGGSPCRFTVGPSATPSAHGAAAGKVNEPPQPQGRAAHALRPRLRPPSPPRRPGGGGSPQRQSPLANSLSSLILPFALRAGSPGPAFANCPVHGAQPAAEGWAPTGECPQPPLYEAGFVKGRPSTSSTFYPGFRGLAHGLVRRWAGVAVLFNLYDDAHSVGQGQRP
jgi:hypothetical protein